MTPTIINILAAELAEGHRIHLRFDDGSEQTVDFGPFLSNSAHPEVRAWLDPSKFATFRLQHGELVWGDYELCFPMIDLYRNRIDHRGTLDAVA